MLIRRLTGSNSWLNLIKRVTERDYIPTEGDIALCCYSSNGSEESVKIIGELTYRMTKPGRAASKSKRVLSSFGDMLAVLFVADLSTYNRVFPDDTPWTRLQETLDEFKDIINSPPFDKKPVILFFENLWLFKDQLQRHNLYSFSPDHQSDSTSGDRCEIVNRFHLQNQNPKRDTYSHFMDGALPTTRRFLMAAVNDSIIAATMKDTKFLGVW